VPGGTFDRGWDVTITGMQGAITQREGNSATEVPVIGAQRKEAAVATIAPFSMDRYEVTIGRFRAFHRQYEAFLRMHPKPEDGAHPTNPLARWHSEWSGKPDFYAQSPKALIDKITACDTSIGESIVAPTSSSDSRPMACVSWYEAFLFCVFDGGRRLPTEAEWNFAAAGGGEGRPYPWGTPDPLDVPMMFGNVQRPGSTGASQAVGSFPAGAGKWGHLDLAGNVLEFVFDTSDADGSLSVYVDQPVDPVQLLLPPNPYVRISRGGSFGYGPARARAIYRKEISETSFGANPFAVRFNDLGWRCAH
jgi:formylglycine-generating enzyme required for sulfatase activity